MGFWNVQPRDLRVGDEIRVGIMGGKEFLTVEAIDLTPAPEVRVRLAWGPHVPRDSFWDDLQPDQKLTVRR